MGLFYMKKERKNLSFLFPTLLLIGTIFIFIFCTNELSKNSTSQEYEILDRALSRSITQCYALEGTYPPSLSYLEEHYGLTYNKEHFFVDYQYIGSNLLPDYTIIRRD